MTFEYYMLPYCKPAGGVKWKTLGMGEVVDANRMASTPYDLAFRVERTNQRVCKKELSKEDAQKFRDAVRDDWYFQMYFDDLPVWGFVGKVEKIIPNQYE
ncbi:Putative phagocytic receptor 1b [Monoraphidium neglectum]|uniref:Transmembrane 9 superfamily member n=1 Tax=Monoraphidium neglectum TaxID=145388 RepID=A0A0D2KET2_9CHLO|nr:Putative phagocytic receptor 1b [Monoraphidium neglectum]KIY94368.1 Putative phagocytic receptor 1b [Monoraphidium neglectum]|eukprot:XP_013893388.1 Putative phagocytic receptor 1b [Monoraphidium neglectum]